MRILLLICLFSITSIASAEVPGLDSPQAVRQFADSVMESVIGNSPEKVFDALSKNWNIDADRLEVTKADTRQQRKEHVADYGKSLGYEFLFQHQLGSSLLGLVYLERTEKKPVVWYFAFYKPDAKWIVNSAWWNTKSEGYLFEQQK